MWFLTFPDTGKRFPEVSLFPLNSDLHKASQKKKEKPNCTHCIRQKASCITALWWLRKRISKTGFRLSPVLITPLSCLCLVSMWDVHRREVNPKAGFVYSSRSNSSSSNSYPNLSCDLAGALLHNGCWSHREWMMRERKSLEISEV